MVTETVGGTGIIGMGEEMVVVEIGEVIDLVAEGVGLAVEGFTAEEEGIGIDRLRVLFFFWSVGRFASAAVERREYR